MPTTTTALQLRKPLATEAPDGAGQIGNLADDIDQMLRVGGAEYAANLAAIQAISAARTYKGKLAYAAETDAIYRFDGTNWKVWTWLAIPPASFGAVANGAALGSSELTEANVVSGVATVNFSLGRGGGMSLNTAYFNTIAGFRPANSVFGGGGVYSGSTSSPAMVGINSAGSIFIAGASGTIASVQGTLTYRCAS